MQEPQDAVTDLGFAKVDHLREDRWGLPEAVLGLGKTPAQVSAIVASLLERNRGPILVTRATPEMHVAVRGVAPEAEYHETARMVRVMREPVVTAGRVGIVAAGTADLPVAEEAALTAESAGADVDRVYDVGVAGLHRLMAQAERIAACDCLVVAAGMEGALPTVVAGLTGSPVLAVPTSVG